VPRRRFIGFLRQLALAFLVVMAAWMPLAAQTSAACRDWHDCQSNALEAEQAKNYEAFHDLAWRAVQIGPRNDFALLFLLARAQVLSGRAHDALVMLDRLAVNPAAATALTDEAFARTRELPGWADVEAKIAATRDHTNASATPTVSSRPRASAASSAAPATPRARPTPAVTATPDPAAAANVPPRPAMPAIQLPSTETARFAASPFVVASLAYDAVSDRAIVADRTDRKVIVASLSRATDLVRDDSAGFHDITAIEADPVRGDLWVASGNDAGVFEMHRLQLVSGRPLKTYALDTKPSRIVDIAVGRSGRVFALDAAGSRILEWRSGAAAFEPLVSFDAHEVTSLALTERDGSPVAFVADADGILRVDLGARRATRLRQPKELSLSGIERLRYSKDALVAVRIDGGVRQLVRVDFARGGSSIDHLTLIDTSEPLGAAGFLTVSGDHLFYLGGSRRTGDTGQASDLVVYRVTLP